MEGVSKYPIKNMSRTAKFLPTFGKVKGIAGDFVLDIFFMGYLYRPPSTICFQISKLVFDTLLWA
jgi:hypothetical protein